MALNQILLLTYLLTEHITPTPQPRHTTRKSKGSFTGSVVWCARSSYEGWYLWATVEFRTLHTV